MYEKNPQWRVIGESITGASHLRNNLPNQDNFKWEPKDEFRETVMLAVADGHGSLKSFRSDKGAWFAVSAAMMEMRELVSYLSKETNISQIKRFSEEKLPEAIVRLWQRGIDGHLRKAPLNQEEIENLREKEGEKSIKAIEKNPMLVYGSTLLAALVTPDFMLFLQLGDGDILVVSDTGIVSNPIAKDEKLIANETTSLCDKDAWKNFRVTFQTLSGQPPALIMISTDGYANSFVDETSFRKVGADYLQIIRESSLDDVRLKLPEWLNEASLQGSGDDITLGIIARKDALINWSIANNFEDPVAHDR